MLSMFSRMINVIKASAPRWFPLWAPTPMGPSGHRNVVGLSRTLEDITAPEDAKWWYEWVSASSTRNWMLKDPVCDWFDCTTKGARNRARYPTGPMGPVGHKPKGIPSDHHDQFHSFILERGNEFENGVLDDIIRVLGQDNVLDLECRNPRHASEVEKTLDAMNEGIPVIHGAAVHDVQSKTYGIVDLLVRSDWLERLFHRIPVSVNPTDSATLLHDPDEPQNPSGPPYHYIVIDIKYSVLQLTVDGIHILNSGSFPAYKSQLYIYERALNAIQGYSNSCAYILGRGWSLRTRTGTLKSDNPFDQLGTIDYNTRDAKYIDMTSQALEWLRDCRSESATHWNLTSPPLTREELYVNMCNTHDGEYHDAKRTLAEKYNELTLLWRVGPVHRKHAHDLGIYSWTDPRCTPATLGIKTAYTSGILNAILTVNQPHTRVYKSGQKIVPRYIESRMCNWHVRDPIEFYVDFEVINYIMFRESSPNYKNRKSLILTIGVGYYVPGTNEWKYEHFTVNDDTLDEENRVCTEFSAFVEDLAAEYGTPVPKCYHWAHAEQTFWKDVKTRHKDTYSHWASNWEWVDLLELFQKEPIAIRGSLSFGLKDIAKAMRSHGMIQATWPESDCTDGLSAMLCAVKSIRKSRELGIPLHSDPLMKDIIAYNEADVKVVGEILQYLRTHHVQPDDLDGSSTPTPSPSPGQNPASSPTLVPSVRRSSRLASK